MPKQKATVIFADERELHMVGKYTCVAWNTREEAAPVMSFQGVEYHGTKLVRSGKPYIDFVSIRDDHGEKYVDEDSPVEGGLPEAFAIQIRDELSAAILYLAEQP